MKRRNANGQARKEEMDMLEDQEGEQAGVFARASEDKLKQRRIVTAKRPVRPKPAETATATGSSNPFSGFQVRLSSALLELK